MKDLSWQSMALGGALVVAFSAAIPGSHTSHGSAPAPAAPKAAAFEVEARDDGVVEAILTLDPDTVVTDLSIWSPDAVFGDPVEVEPGIWVAEAAAHLAGGCYTATAEVALACAAVEPHTKAKKSKKSTQGKKSKKTVQGGKVKASSGRGDGHGDSDSDHGKKSKAGSKKQCDEKGRASSLVLTLTATGCGACVMGPDDDPFTPVPPG